MSDDGDLAEKGSAIFDRLRAATQSPQTVESAGGVRPPAVSDDPEDRGAQPAAVGDAGGREPDTAAAGNEVEPILEREEHLGRDSAARGAPAVVNESVPNLPLPEADEGRDEPPLPEEDGRAVPAVAEGAEPDGLPPLPEDDEPTAVAAARTRGDEADAAGQHSLSAAELPGSAIHTVLTDDPALPLLGADPAVLATMAPPSPSGAPRLAASLRPLPRVLAIANQKGGVGKTTTAVNLSAALAELGYRVLVCDLDPQGNATTGLGVNPRNLEGSIYDVLLHDMAMEDCIEPTSLRNLFVVPATIDLAGAEIELVPAFSRELKLKRAMEGIIDDFDFVLIDCPPSLGLITVNGLAAATEVVVPIQCEYYALEGLGQLLRNVNLVQGNLNPGLEVSAIILTMYDARTKLAEQVANEVRLHFGDRVCRNIVPRTVRLSEAPSFGQPIIVFDPTSRGALAYRELAKEVSGGAPQRIG